VTISPVPDVATQASSGLLRRGLVSNSLLITTDAWAHKLQTIANTRNAVTFVKRSAIAYGWRLPKP